MRESCDVVVSSNCDATFKRARARYSLAVIPTWRRNSRLKCVSCTPAIAAALRSGTESAHGNSSITRRSHSGCSRGGFGRLLRQDRLEILNGIGQAVGAPVERFDHGFHRAARLGAENDCTAQRRSAAVARKLDVETSCVDREPVGMFFSGLMNDDRAAAADFRHGVVDFDIRSGQHDRYERRRVAMVLHRAAAAMIALEDGARFGYALSLLHQKTDEFGPR